MVLGTVGTVMWRTFLNAILIGVVRRFTTEQKYSLIRKLQRMHRLSRYRPIVSRLAITLGARVLKWSVKVILAAVLSSAAISFSMQAHAQSVVASADNSGSLAEVVVTAEKRTSTVQDLSLIHI